MDDLSRVVGQKGTYKVQFCQACDLPILIFGLINPCAHVFCLQCANKMNECLTCNSKIKSLEAILASTPVYFSMDARMFTAKEALSQHYREMLLRDRQQVSVVVSPPTDSQTMSTSATKSVETHPIPTIESTPAISNETYAIPVVQSSQSSSDNREWDHRYYAVGLPEADPSLSIPYGTQYYVHPSSTYEVFLPPNHTPYGFPYGSRW